MKKLRPRSFSIREETKHDPSLHFKESDCLSLHPLGCRSTETGAAAEIVSDACLPISPMVSTRKNIIAVSQSSVF